ncbi:MCE family protein [Mycobacterium deserti]|uniref:MCE family protein n=1 Tax=Mycobacterium deserti TaxID=2978347 RepID=A0ABT2M6G8_9MYCO|nr:MCE family protein [Mycobacterium deserti]MCT7657858.1 MCE family protein [Mycobacterium deserti]
MTRLRNVRATLAVTLVLTLIAGVVQTFVLTAPGHTRLVAYFANSNGIFVGDEVRILGIPVGEITEITPEPQRARITFQVDSRYRIPADVKAVILSPSLVTARAVALTPPYGGGVALSDGAVIPETRTAVPVEWDDVRVQLEKLTETLQPSQPGGLSTMGAFVTTVADNVRGRGPDIRSTVIELSEALSALGDHSGDVFATVKNLSTLVSGLSASTELMQQLNINLAAVTALLANGSDEVAQALSTLNAAAVDVRAFVADNREALGTTTDHLALISAALVESLGDVKQALHITPNTAANFANVYQPAQGGISAALALNNFANPISFLCGAIQAASRLGAEQSAKLCVQYLAPIVKNRQLNFLPLGVNPFVGATARPNEITYSEDRLRPIHTPPAQPRVATDPTHGIEGIMAPPGVGP